MNSCPGGVEERNIPYQNKFDLLILFEAVVYEIEDKSIT